MSLHQKAVSALVTHYLCNESDSLFPMTSIYSVPQIFATELYPSPNYGTVSDKRNTSDENRSCRPASPGSDRYLSEDILDLPCLSPLRHPMVDNGLGCLEE